MLVVSQQSLTATLAVHLSRPQIWSLVTETIVGGDLWWHREQEKF